MSTLLRDLRRSLCEVRGTTTKSEVQDKPQRSSCIESSAQGQELSGPEDFGHVGRIAREAASSQRHGHSPECHGVCP